MKKVLIITYYWPPAGGPGVQRFVYFVKYLREFGWEPIVYTIEDGNYPVLDPSFEKEFPENLRVLKQKAFEPHKLYNKVLGKKKKGKVPTESIVSKNKSFLQELAVFIRGNFFIPDARMFWIKPSVKFLTNYLNENKVDAIISTSPPQSTHLIAQKIAKKFDLPWIADFRDPWTKISYFDELKLTSYAKNKHKRLEKSVLESADMVTTVTPTLRKDLLSLGAKEVTLITNGFDEKELLSVKPNANKFTITYVGSLTYKRNPESLWKAIKRLSLKDKNFEAKFQLVMIGNISAEVFENIEKNGLTKHLVIKPYIPHSEVFEYYQKSDLLLLVGIPKLKEILTGKVFEYLQARRPIFSINPENSDISNLLDETSSGLNADFDDEQKTVKNLSEFWSLYQSDKLNTSYRITDKNLGKYSRRNLTKMLSSLLDNISK